MKAHSFPRDPLILAPMAALTTSALRCLVRGFGGCDLYFTEMISAAALLQRGPYESFYINPEPEPEKLVYQLVGSDREKAASAAEFLDGLPGFGVDFNMGCSAPEIVRAGAGVAWMKNAENARRLAAALRSRLKNKTLSVKLRVGYEDNFDYLVSFCRGLAEEGADFITLHPRIKKEKFSRVARWDYITALKAELSIPLVGNGDIRSWQDYSLKKTRCGPDGIMIGRAAARAPWFFAFLRKKEEDPGCEMTVDLQAAAAEFLDLLPRFQPGDFLESRSKRFFSWFCQNLMFGHNLFVTINNSKGFDAVRKVVFDYFTKHPEARYKTEKN
ncbi:MAG: tRNA-dihydrouridine synthase family protein [Spirochaetales bacterium]|jgi:tRNA-dihydrouridine synthase|nr:tRNA-dihydrouridine synthase family protein [Spirochaetales bacterium]